MGRQARPQDVVLHLEERQRRGEHAPFSGRRSPTLTGSSDAADEILPRQPRLNRRERQVPDDLALVGLRRRRRFGDGGQSRQRRMSEASPGRSLTPRSAARAAICTLRIESPPSSKKLSSTPTLSTPSTSAHS